MAVDLALLALAGLVAWRCGRRGLRLDALCSLLLVGSVAGLLLAGRLYLAHPAAGAALLGLILAGTLFARRRAAAWRAALVLDEPARSRDRRLGWISGGLKGAAVLVLGALVADVVPPPRPPARLPRAVAPGAPPEAPLDPWTRQAFSRLGRVFGQAVWPDETRGKIHAVRTILSARRDELIGIPEVERILDRAQVPSMLRACQDPQIAQARDELERGELRAIYTLGSNESIRAVLADPELRALLGTVDVQAIARAIERRRVR